MDHLSLPLLHELLVVRDQIQHMLELGPCPATLRDLCLLGGVTVQLLEHAIDINACTITVWRYYPQDTRPTPPTRALGAILAKLHALPRPPIELPASPPLARFTAVLTEPAAQRVLKDDDLEFLKQQARSVLDRYKHLDSRLGVGFIHGDSYTGDCIPGNWTLLSPATTVDSVFPTMPSPNSSTPTALPDGRNAALAPRRRPFSTCATSTRSPATFAALHAATARPQGTRRSPAYPAPYRSAGRTMARAVAEGRCRKTSSAATARAFGANEMKSRRPRPSR